MRPIDLLDNLAKAPLAAREQNIQQSSADQAQRLGTMRLNNEHAREQMRPPPSAETDAAQNRIDREPDGQRSQHQRHRDNQDASTNSDPDTETPPQGASPNSREFDVVI